MQSLQITQPWQAASSEHMEIWSVKLCFLHLLPANALLELPQQPGGFHYTLPFKAHKPTLWGFMCLVQSPARLYQVEHTGWKPSLCLPAPQFLTLRWWAQKKTLQEQESFMYGQKKPLLYAQRRINQSHGTETAWKYPKWAFLAIYSSVQQKIMGLKH